MAQQHLPEEAPIILAITTMRKGEILPRKWEDVCLEGEIPFIHVPVTKNSDPKTVPLPQIVVDALKKLPSYETSVYLFPSRPTARHPSPKQPFRWDFGKEFRRACLKAGLRKKDGSLAENLRIHAACSAACRSAARSTSATLGPLFYSGTISPVI